MRNRTFGLALATPLVTVLGYGSTTLADEDIQQTDGQQTACAAASDAVTTLPEPLNSLGAAALHVGWLRHHRT